MKRIVSSNYTYQNDDELDKAVHDLLTEISQEADMRQVTMGNVNSADRQRSAKSGHTPCSSCQDCIVEHPMLVYGNHKRGQVHTRPRLILRSRKRTASVPCSLPRTLTTG